jgi:moderate conductance mechanosensitive channel
VLGLGRTRLPRSDRFSRRRHSNPRSGPLASDVVLRIHTHLSGSANAVPRIPDELRRARDRSADELDGTGAWRLLALGLVMAFGLALELGFRRLTSRWVDVEARDRMRQPEGRHRLHGVRLAVALGGVLTFAVASSGAFLLIEWPALARESVLSILITVVIARLALAAVRSALEPHGAGPEGRLVEVDDAAVRFWQPRITLFIGYFAAGYIAVMLARTYGLSPEVSRLTAYALGLGLLAIAIEATWRRPARRSDVEGAPERLWAWNLLVSAYLTALWVLWVIGAPGLFWIAVYAGFLPRAVHHCGVLARRISASARAAGAGRVGALGAVVIERGARALLLILAVLWLAHVLEIRAEALQGQDTVATRLIRGLGASLAIS